MKITNPDKVFWPEDNITKGDLIEYYKKVSEYILPHIKGRPESLNRYPNGIHGESFYQKNLTDFPESLEIFEDYSEVAGHSIHYAVCNKMEDILYLINLGCITLNVWNSRVGKPEYPDYLVFDLDPETTDFDQIRRTAFEIYDVLNYLGIVSYIKTSGKRGLHIFIPTGAKYTYERLRDFAHIVAIIVNTKLKDITSLERSPSKRQGKVYIDYLQNRMGATMASPYSVRAVSGARVSTPITWDELSHITNESFDINNIFIRLNKIKDPWKKMKSTVFDLDKAIRKLSEYQQEF